MSHINEITKADLTDLSADLMRPTSQGHSTAAGAERAMSSTAAWKPSFARRQSWNKEEQKHELQMAKVGSVQEGPGFTERRS